MRLINDSQRRLDDLISNGYRVNIEHYLRRGLDIFRKRTDLFLLYTALYLLLMPFGGFVVSAPLTAGFFLVAHRLEKGEDIVFEDFFEGFRYFLPLLVLTILTGIILTLGYFALIIPGIYLTVAYTFSVLFVVFNRMDFWEAMENSRKLVTREWFAVFGFVLVLALLNIIGALAFGVGLLFSIPISFCATYAAFDDIVGTDEIVHEY